MNAIIEEVRANRDAAVFSYTKKFDGADIDAGNILVTEEEIREAYARHSSISETITADSARIPGLIHRNPALS